MSKGSKERRRKLFQEFYYTVYKEKECKDCGVKDERDSDGFIIRKAKLTVHHIDNDPSNNELSNLVTLCRKCHDKIHKMR